MKTFVIKKPQIIGASTDQLFSRFYAVIKTTLK